METNPQRLTLSTFLVTLPPLACVLNKHDSHEDIISQTLVQMQDWMIISSYARNALYSFRSYGSSRGWDTKLKCTPLRRILTGIKIMFGLSCSLLVERELSTTRWHHHCGNSHRAVQQINIHSHPPTGSSACPYRGFATGSNR